MAEDANSVSRRNDPSELPRLRTTVLAPIFNHVRTLEGVLSGLAAYGTLIIVINDGSTDDTASVLSRWQRESEPERVPLRSVLVHQVNQGKAAALRTGFAEAARLGCTHAATIDTDGQHDPADLRQLLDLCEKCPDALIIGARVKEGSHAPGASRVGRVLSNWFVWLESGVRVTDSQSGMRIYPLAYLSALSGSASRYGFETEVIVRAGWYGVPVHEVPIRCIYRVPGGRTTHFRLGGDSFASAKMHARLLVRALLPGPARLCDHGSGTGSIPRRLGGWFSPRRLQRMARGDAASRERFAASIGVGLLMATLPVYGVKTVACLWLSGRFRLHPLAVIGTSSLSTPPIGLLFVGLSICVGGLLLHGQIPELSSAALKQATQWSAVSSFVAEWIVGSVVAGIGLGLLGYGVLRVLLSIPMKGPAAEAAAGASSPRPPFS